MAHSKLRQTIRYPYGFGWNWFIKQYAVWGYNKWRHSSKNFIVHMITILWILELGWIYLRKEKLAMPDIFWNAVKSDLSMMGSERKTTKTHKEKTIKDTQNCCKLRFLRFCLKGPLIISSFCLNVTCICQLQMGKHTPVFLNFPPLDSLTCFPFQLAQIHPSIHLCRWLD